MPAANLGKHSLLAVALLLWSGPFSNNAVASNPWLSPCAVDCGPVFANDGPWSHIHSLDTLDACNQTTVFQLSLYNPINNPDTHLILRACSIQEPDPIRLSSRASALTSTAGCLEDATVRDEELDIPVHLSSALTSGSSISRHVADVQKSINSISQSIGNEANCATTIAFAKSGSAIVGVYFGAAIQKGSALEMLEKFVSLLETSPDEGDQAILQVCGGKRPSTFSAGIFVTSNGNTSAAQESLRAWSDGRCSPGSDGVNSGMSLSMRVGFLPPTSFQLPESAKAPLLVDEGGAGDKHARSLAARAECKAIQAVPNDGCWSLAKNCGISQSDFGKYNAGVANLCASGIQNGSYYCCSAGTLPDRSPKPLADGTCYTVTANSDTRCYLLENQYHIPTGNIEEYNKHTWGWTGCSGIIPGMKMCLSKGDPPMPTILGDVQCGPQKPGTTRPKSGTNLETLNPCPLNACCDGWGKCGTTKEFCTPSPAGSGAPGAFKPGTNGCFSNCGTNIINNKDGPDLFARIAYFEAWNTAKRNCSTLDADDIPNHFTHVHYAFVDLSPDGVPDPSRNQDQFVKFKNRRDWKRIPSFGGWAYSTELGTYRIMRDGVLSANRERFATNIVKWVVSNGFDGVDFDWEYPGEPDIPDIPPEGPEKGKDYLEFLKLVRQKLPRDKTLSIAAPASFWYLKAFPISDIAKVVDYFIYMTYDLHGQWDYKNRWASPGCSNDINDLRGNCLRSHINFTETENALSMITKAGAPSKKVIVGITSYGRSFKMMEEGCTGPMCRFDGVGPKHESAAAPGRCTDTRGYIGEWEIREIIRQYEGGIEMGDDGDGYRRWHDSDSDSDILVYDKTEWVAWMDYETKLRRWTKYLGWNFGGTSDWAIDLSGGHDSLAEGKGTDGDDTDGPDDCHFDREFKDIDDVEARGSDLPPLCRSIHAVGALATMLDAAMDQYHDVNNGYDAKFKYYEMATRDMAAYNLAKCMEWVVGPCNRYFTCVWRERGDELQRGRCHTMSAKDPQVRETWSIEYILEDADGFHATLADEFGIDASWVQFGDVTYTAGCQGSMGPPGSGFNPPRKNDSDPTPGNCQRNPQERKNFPQRDDHMQVPNPKDVVVAAEGNMTAVQGSLTAQYLELLYGQWDGAYNEAVEVASMPVLMVVQAVDSMAHVKEVGAEVEEREREQKTKEIVTWVLTGVFFLVPFVGEAAGAMGWATATMVRMAALIGMIGDVGLTTVDIVENPAAAPLAALGLFIPGGLPRSSKNVRDVYRKKKELGTEGLARLGDIFKRNDNKIQSLVDICKG